MCADTVRGEVGRGPDPQWSLFGWKLQAPSGFGRAIERGREGERARGRVKARESEREKERKIRSGRSSAGSFKPHQVSGERARESEGERARDLIRRGRSAAGSFTPHQVSSVREREREREGEGVGGRET